MWRFLLVALTALRPAIVMGQDYSVRGIVRDVVSNEILEGATVQLDGESIGAVTDEQGFFVLEGLTAGEHTLIVKFLGYATAREQINVPAETLIEIRLEESAQMTDEVIVFATRASIRTPASFVNVTSKTLQQQNFGQDMPILLNWTPSMVTTSDAGAGIGYTGVRIRGSDATRINVTINGIPYNDSESQGTFWVDIPDIASSTQSVQVQRGVGTSTNGAGSFGGSINVQTNSLQAEPYTEVKGGAGSFGTWRYSLKAGTGLINQRWAFDGRVSRIQSEGYVDRAASDLDSYYLTGGFYGRKTMVKGIAFGGHENTYQSWNGIDGQTMRANRTFNSAGALYDEAWSNVIGYHDNEVDDYRQDHYQLHLTQKLTAHWNANLALHYTYGRGYYEQYKQRESFSSLGLPDLILGDTAIDSGDFIIRKWLDNKFFGGTFSFNYEKENTGVIIGGAFNRYGDARHFGEIAWAQYAGSSTPEHHYYDGESLKDDFNIYSKWNIALSSKLNAFIDLQYRHVFYRTGGIDDGLAAYDVEDTFDFFNPKAGVSFALSAGDMLYTSYAIAHREPNRTDYLSGVERPNRERLGDLETGWKRHERLYDLEVNYYHMHYKDQLVLTGQLDNVGNPIRGNVGSSFRTGVEVTGLIRLASNLSWSANATWSVNRNRDYFVLDENSQPVSRNTSIILSPNWIAGSQFTWSPFPNFQASLLQKYVGKQFLDNSEREDLTLAPYFITDLRFSYDVPAKGFKGIELSVLVNNLFDAEYESNGYTYDGVPYYYPQAGRNFLCMATFSF